MRNSIFSSTPSTFRSNTRLKGMAPFTSLLMLKVTSPGVLATLNAFTAVRAASADLSDYRVAFVPSFEDARDSSDVWHLPGEVKLQPDETHSIPEDTLFAVGNRFTHGLCSLSRHPYWPADVVWLLTLHPLGTHLLAQQCQLVRLWQQCLCGYDGSSQCHLAGRRCQHHCQSTRRSLC